MTEHRVSLQYGAVSATQYLRVRAAEVNTFLDGLWEASNIAAPAMRLYDAMRYSLCGTGKRIRPVLCMATAESFGVPVERALTAAAAIECIHTYSLIHDDLPSMDNDDLRRGRPTNHKVYGDAIALLAGDGLLTFAFELLSQKMDVLPHRQVRMVAVLAQAAGASGMVGGQAADILATGQGGNEELLQYIHINKTARLIQASIVIGGLFADLTPTEDDALAAFGLALGLVFQMVDDVLDIVGDEQALGKSVGSDVGQNKLTYPSLIGVEATLALAEKTLLEGLAQLEKLSVPVPLLYEIAQFVLHRDR